MCRRDGDEGRVQGDEEVAWEDGGDDCRGEYRALDVFRIVKVVRIVVRVKLEVMRGSFVVMVIVVTVGVNIEQSRGDVLLFRRG